jgi:non-specific serine/threonine protein kinase
LTGSTKNRQEVVDRFQSPKGAPVFLISLKAGGTGLNLTSADYVFHIDPWWNPSAENQASDRAYRIGQTKPVFVYKIITRNSIEERVLELQERKRFLMDAVIQTESSLFKRLSKDDILDLFK